MADPTASLPSRRTTALGSSPDLADRLQEMAGPSSAVGGRPPLVRGGREGSAVMYEGLLAETIRINGHNGDLIDAYFARPLGGGPYASVVVVHHMPGWDEATK